MVSKKKRPHPAEIIASQIVEASQQKARRAERVCFSAVPQARILFETLAQMQSRTPAAMVAILATRAAVDFVLQLDPEESAEALRLYILGCNRAGFPANFDTLNLQVVATKVEEEQ